MHFEVEKSGILQAVFDQYCKIEGVPREFHWIAIGNLCNGVKPGRIDDISPVNNFHVHAPPPNITQ
jgi:hypothetical protein